MDKEQAYIEILTVLNKHADIIESEKELDIRRVLNDRVDRCGLERVFGFNLSEFNGSVSGGYLTHGYDGVHSEMKIILMGGNRTISWSDDGRQPDKEWLFVIEFSTGAYTFGENYPKETFDKFLSELKKLEPKYIDTANKTLYFDASNAKAAFEALPVIRGRYNEIASKEAKAKKIAEVEDQLKRLKE